MGAWYLKHSLPALQVLCRVLSPLKQASPEKRLGQEYASEIDSRQQNQCEKSQTVSGVMMGESSSERGIGHFGGIKPFKRICPLSVSLGQQAVSRMVDAKDDFPPIALARTRKHWQHHGGIASKRERNIQAFYTEALKTLRFYFERSDSLYCLSRLPSLPSCGYV